MPQALPRVTIDATGAALNWQRRETSTRGTFDKEVDPFWRSGDEMTGGTILPRLMVCFSIQPFTPSTTPESYQRMLEDLEGELLEMGGRDPRPGGTWERQVIRAEFEWCSPMKLGTLANWWREKAAALAALAHLEAGY